MPENFQESDYLVLLAERRRRWTLRILRESSPLSTIRLAERIGRREHENPSTEHLRAIYIDLHDDHLPRLEEAGAVVYDRDEGTVRLGENFDLLVRELEEDDESGTACPEETRGEEYRTPRWVELFVRSSTPAVVGERVEAVLDRVEQLRDDELITGYRLRQWPPRDSARFAGRASPSFTTRRDIVAEFDAWAEEHGYTLRPAFGRRLEATLGSEGDADEYYEVPLLTLALYEGEALTGVVPCADGQRTYTVADFLSSRDPGELLG